jgi:hypothetical protein
MAGIERRKVFWLLKKYICSRPFESTFRMASLPGQFGRSRFYERFGAAYRYLFAGYE